MKLVVLTTWFLWLCRAVDSTSTTTTEKKTPSTVQRRVSFFGPSFLYDDTPQVVEYHADDDTDFKESRMARIVQFYSPTCGHCVSFKPRYIEIAEKIQLNHPEVEFYAVSCESHRKVCNDYQVRGTPAFYAFKEDSSERIPIQGRVTEEKVVAIFELNTEKTEQRQLEFQVENEEQEEEKDAMDGPIDEEQDQDDDNPIDEPGDFDETPPEEPEEDENNYNNEDNEKYDEEEEEEEVEDVFANNRGFRPDGEVEEDPWFPKEQERLGITQAKPSIRAGAFAAREKTKMRRQQNFPVRTTLRTRLEAHNKHPGGLFLRKKRVSDGFNPGQVPEEGATNLMKAHRAHTAEFGERRQKILEQIEKKKGKSARRKVEKQLNDILSRKAPRTTDGKVKLPYKKVVAPKRLGERIPIVKRVVKMSTEESLMLDTSLAFIDGLKQAPIFRMNHPLTVEEKKILVDWLQLLSIALPQEWGLHELIDDLMVKKTYISQRRENMLQVLDKHAPKRRSYSPSCQGSKIPFNCGFWKLLHTVTIGIAEHKGGLALIDEGSLKEDARTFTPAAAADTIRDYMGSFFPCPRCAQNFIRQYDDCDNLERCLRLADDENAASDADWKELAKWLWEFHNSVSVHILHEIADGKRKSHARFSLLSAEAGPGKAAVVDEIAALWPTLDSCIKCFDNEGGWDEDAVFLHLESQYWPASDPDPKTARLLRLEQEVDPTGSGLTMVLVVIGIVLFFVMRQSISKESIQRAILVAKSVRTGAGVSQKRSD